MGRWDASWVLGEHHARKIVELEREYWEDPTEVPSARRWVRPLLYYSGRHIPFWPPGNESRLDWSRIEWVWLWHMKCLVGPQQVHSTSRGARLLPFCRQNRPIAGSTYVLLSCPWDVLRFQVDASMLDCSSLVLGDWLLQVIANYSPWESVWYSHLRRRPW